MTYFNITDLNIRISNPQYHINNIRNYFDIDEEHSSTSNSSSSNNSTKIITMNNITLLSTILIKNNDSISSSSSSSSTEGDELNLINNEIVQIIFCIIYLAVFILGLFGNILVCYIVLFNKAMQTVTNIFITNLALSDIFLSVLAVPFTPLYTFMGGWAFGKVLCHLVPYAQGCSIYISTLTLTSIAIDRYFVIIYPFQPRMKLSTCIGIIIAIWIVSLLATLPYGLYVKVISMESNNDNDDDNNNTFCEEDWPSEYYRKIFGSVTTILQFVIPFVVITICYTLVSKRLNARARAKLASTKNIKKEEADRERKRRTNIMLISMVAIFGISWLPINVVNIFSDFYVRSNEWRFYTLLFFIAHAIAMSSTCYNPFLYAWLNENFRKEFKKILPCFNQTSTPIASTLNNNMKNCTTGTTGQQRNNNEDENHRENDQNQNQDQDQNHDHDEQDTSDDDDDDDDNVNILKVYNKNNKRTRSIGTETISNDIEMTKIKKKNIICNDDPSKSEIEIVDDSTTLDIDGKLSVSLFVSSSLPSDDDDDDDDDIDSISTSTPKN